MHNKKFLLSLSTKMWLLYTDLTNPEIKKLAKWITHKNYSIKQLRWEYNQTKNNNKYFITTENTWIFVIKWDKKITQFSSKVCIKTEANYLLN